MIRKIVTQQFVRPADTTAYASGDIVANSTTAANVQPLAFDFKAKKGTLVINRARLAKSGAVLTNAAFRVHLHTASPRPVTNGDNGVWLTSRANYLGSIDVTIDKAFASGSQGGSTSDAKIGASLALADTARIYATIEARGAYTPASAEIFTLTLEGEVDS